MEIVFVYRQSGYGGIALHNETISRKLVQMGHHVSMITSHGTSTQPTQYVDNSVTVYSLIRHHPYYLSKIPFFGRYLRSFTLWEYSYRVSRLLQRLSREKQIDIVEFADVDGEGFAYSRRKNRALIVVRCHTPNFVLREYYGSAERPYDVSLNIAMEKYVIRHADGVTAPSNDLAKTISAICGIKVEQIKVIPNALDIQKFSNSHSPYPDMKKGGFTILHVGRLERIKGIEILIHAAPAVFKQFPGAQFVLIGGGSTEYLEILHRLIHAHGIRDEQFLLLGNVKQELLIQWYKKADIVVVPTLNYESFSYTVAQALACGLPVVASRVGGIPETIGSKESAILVEPGNIDQLTKAIIALCQNPARRRLLGEAAQHQAESHFSDAVVTKQMETFYLSML